jgi:hypothetical protein
MNSKKSGNANGNKSVSMNDIAKQLAAMQAQLAELRTENTALKSGKKASVAQYAFERIDKDAEGKPVSRITVKDGKAFVQSYSGLKATWNGEPAEGWIEGKMSNGRKGYYIPKKAAPVVKAVLETVLKHL